ncbi:MAG: hypothetical protein KA020_09385, partial [Planctomycetes bacterium]|nr:hypothetical protein [Planctomycetota bacterium]
MKYPILSSILSLALSSALAAQNCSDNTYPVTLVDAYGVPAPTTLDPVTNEPVSRFQNEDVYVAFDPNIPSGTYYVHVTDRVDGVADMVLSTNDPMDRFVLITNNGAGNITLSLPMSANAPVTGLGLGGIGQSLLLQPFTSNPAEPCQFKAWCGDWWDLTNGPSNPYMLQGGLNPNTMTCAVRSYSQFQIGDGTPADLSGVVFADANQNGEQDTGEAGLPGWTVNLVTNGVSVSAVTGNDGSYQFPNIVCAEYSVELTMQSGFLATTPVVYQIESCGCADV